MARYCSNCESPLNDGVSFCDNCGTAVQPQNGEPHFATAAERDAYLQGLQDAQVSASPEDVTADPAPEPEPVEQPAEEPEPVEQPAEEQPHTEPVGDAAPIRKKPGKAWLWAIVAFVLAVGVVIGVFYLTGVIGK